MTSALAKSQDTVTLPKSMADKPRILFCHCTYAQEVAPEVLELREEPEVVVAVVLEPHLVLQEVR